MNVIIKKIFQILIDILLKFKFLIWLQELNFLLIIYKILIIINIKKNIIIHHKLNKSINHNS